MMRDMRDEPAGWYRDLERPNLHRYWSGERWSEWIGEERWSGDDAADLCTGIRADNPSEGRRGVSRGF